MAMMSFGQKKKDTFNNRYPYPVFKTLESFENEAILDTWKATDGELSLSELHAKDGKSSLEWKWKKGSVVTVKNPAFLKEAGKSRNGGMMLWLYSPKVTDGTFHFVFKDTEGNIQFEFDYLGNFEGWRGSWMSFRTDLGYKGKKELVSMEVYAPNNLEEGVVYFDMVNYVKKVMSKNESSYQWQKPASNGFAWGTYRWSQYEVPEPIQKSVTKAQKADFTEITKRFEHWILGSNTFADKKPYALRENANARYIKSNVKKFDKLNIVRHADGRITGASLFSRHSPYAPAYTHIGEDVLENMPLALALDYKINGNKSSLDKLLLLLDHLNDQGWAEGSGMETLDHLTNRVVGYVYALYLCKDELKKASVLEREMSTLDWMVTFNQCFTDEEYEITADAMRTRLMFRLVRVLIMDDSPEKVMYMSAVRNYIQKSLRVSPGFADTIKPDFMGYHHRGVYANGYSPNGFHNASIAVYLLSKTQFAIAEEYHGNLRQAALAQRVIAHRYHTPFSVGGRLSNHSPLISEFPTYVYLAFSGWKGEEVDAEMSGVAARLWDENDQEFTQLFSRAGANISYFNTLGSMELMLQLLKDYPEKEAIPSGFYDKPYAGLAVKRKDNWLVSMKGYSQYIYDFESGGKENRYGRYISYGNMQILSGDKGGHKENGYALDKGWDWNRWAGTTTVNLPLDLLLCEKYTKKQKKDDVQSKHRNFSKKTFMGALSLDDDNGMFAMELEDKVFQKKFEAKKSAFFFDNEIILLGSNISNVANTTNKVETTLFQNELSQQKQNLIVNGKEISQATYTFEGQKENVFLSDAYGNSYIVPNSSQLKVSKQAQESRNVSNKKATSGNYAVAWFDHGVAPENASYEYMVLVQQPHSVAKSYTKKLPYKVIKKDAQAHVIYHKVKDTYGLSIFDPSVQLENEYFASVSAPVMLMIEKENKETIHLSLCDPDFRRPHYETTKLPESEVFEPSKMQKVQLKLKGGWELEKAYNFVKVLERSKSSTVLEFECVDAQSYAIGLKKSDKKVIN